jgi:hypothetical protein
MFVGVFVEMVVVALWRWLMVHMWSGWCICGAGVHSWSGWCICGAGGAYVVHEVVFLLQLKLSCKLALPRQFVQ